MKDIYINELQKLYDDANVSDFMQEVCEYYASKEDYEDSTYTEEIEPPEIVELVYTLFMLQQRESILDEMSYIHKKYPNIFEVLSSLYNEILINMDLQTLAERKSEGLSLAIGEKASTAEVLDKIEGLCERYDDLSEALDSFYEWLHGIN